MQLQSARQAISRSTVREDLAVALTATWMIIGLFLDGWAHNNEKPESFFTPWHGVLYSGFAACAVAFGLVARRRIEAGVRTRDTLPVAYELGAVGVIGFGLGGIADLIWHTALGVEVDSIALISPPHLLLFSTSLLIASTPFRAGWSDQALVRNVGFRALFPALLGFTLAVATVAFFFMNHTVFRYEMLVTNRVAWSGGSQESRDFWFNLDYTDFLLQTVLMSAPVLALMRRWRPPFGTVTMLWTTVAVLTEAIDGFDTAWTIIAALAAGVCVDALIARLDAGPGNVHSHLIIGGAMPLLLWSAWFLVAKVVSDVVWVAGAWSGTIVMCSLIGFGLALVSMPTLSPTATTNGTSSSGSSPPLPVPVMRPDSST